MRIPSKEPDELDLREGGGAGAGTSVVIPPVLVSVLAPKCELSTDSIADFGRTAQAREGSETAGIATRGNRPIS